MLAHLQDLIGAGLGAQLDLQDPGLALPPAIVAALRRAYGAPSSRRLVLHAATLLPASTSHHAQVAGHLTAGDEFSAPAVLHLHGGGPRAGRRAAAAGGIDRLVLAANFVPSAGESWSPQPEVHAWATEEMRKFLFHKATVTFDSLDPDALSLEGHLVLQGNGRDYRPDMLQRFRSPAATAAGLATDAVGFTARLSFPTSRTGKVRLKGEVDPSHILPVVRFHRLPITQPRVTVHWGDYSYKVTLAGQVRLTDDLQVPVSWWLFGCSDVVITGGPVTLTSMKDVSLALWYGGSKAGTSAADLAADSDPTSTPDRATIDAWTTTYPDCIVQNSKVQLMSGSWSVSGEPDRECYAYSFSSELKFRGRMKPCPKYFPEMLFTMSKLSVSTMWQHASSSRMTFGGLQLTNAGSGGQLVGAGKQAVTLGELAALVVPNASIEPATIPRELSAMVHWDPAQPSAILVTATASQHGKAHMTFGGSVDRQKVNLDGQSLSVRLRLDVAAGPPPHKYALEMSGSLKLFGEVPGADTWMQFGGQLQVTVPAPPPLLEGSGGHVTLGLKQPFGYGVQEGHLHHDRLLRCLWPEGCEMPDDVPDIPIGGLQVDLCPGMRLFVVTGTPAPACKPWNHKVTNGMGEELVVSYDGTHYSLRYSHGTGVTQWAWPQPEGAAEAEGSASGRGAGGGGGQEEDESKAATEPPSRRRSARGRGKQASTAAAAAAPPTRSSRTRTRAHTAARTAAQPAKKQTNSKGRSKRTGSTTKQTKKKKAEGATARTRRGRGRKRGRAAGDDGTEELEDAAPATAGDVDGEGDVAMASVASGAGAGAGAGHAAGALAGAARAGRGRRQRGVGPPPTRRSRRSAGLAAETVDTDTLADLRRKLDDYYGSGRLGLTRSQISVVWELYHDLRSDADPKYKKPKWRGRR